MWRIILNMIGPRAPAGSDIEGLLLGILALALLTISLPFLFGFLMV